MTRVFSLLAASALALVLGCAPSPVPADETPIHSLSPDACAARGGSMMAAGMLGRVQCVVPYSDAGRRCTDGAQCQGDCRADLEAGPEAREGRCQADSRPFGCYAVMENGRAGPALCVD
ncbi:hypothetical protein Q0812_08540 [Brevundimonas sp. 2R-24]|uniref:Secreted protein n=1 Tax=Peiella sedimenti TaxID=3061083 RepID=A0ABT8SNE5_9CAUL|nr:hypothetical protein [Caulobacteraceae bacterium XZ-24]